MAALCIMSNAFVSNSKPEDLPADMQLIMAWLQRRGGLWHLGMEEILADKLCAAIIQGDHVQPGTALHCEDTCASF